MRIRFPLGSLSFARTLVVASCIACCGVASAATVVLRDGTVIQGEVKSLQDGVYTIETASVGTVRVRAADIRSIDESGKRPSTSEAGQPAKGSAPGVDSLDAAKSQIVADPKLLATVLALQNDPEVLAILADPEVMKAIAAGDNSALMSNPKIVALMQNPKVREIVDSLR
jgi:hypothetical protein